MAPVSETQTISETSRQLEGATFNRVGTGVRKVRRKQVDGTDSRGGRKRHAGTLPACQVCFNPGSGFHYGADTCEPCKTFFRRNVSLNGKLECRRGYTCKPAPAKKFKCTACRLKRCLEVGMSLEGIKLGRYTDSKRAHNKTIKTDPKLLSAGPTSYQVQSVPLSPSFVMTPPDTPTDNVDASLSPQPTINPEEENSGRSLGSEINKAINFITLENNVGHGHGSSLVSLQGENPPFRNDYLCNVVDLSVAADPIPNTEEFQFGSSQNSGFTQKDNLVANDMSIICGGLQPVSQTNISHTHSLLDSILYDNVPGPPLVQPTDINSSAIPPLVLGDNDIVNVMGDSNLLPAHNTTLAPNTVLANLNGSITDCKPENTNLYPATPTPSTRRSVPVLESPLTAIEGTVRSGQAPPAQQRMLRTSTIPTPVSGTTSIFLDTFIDHITNIYTHYDAHGSNFFPQIHKLFFEYLEARSMKKRIFGSMRPLPLPEYRQILLDTGLDVDGRLQQLTHRQLPTYEKGYALYLNFVSDVPGFRDLPMADQDILIKGGRIDYWMLSEFDCFNVEMGLHAMADGFVMGVEDKALVLGKQYIKEVFLAAGEFQKLGLSERERNLLKCIYIFSRGSTCSTPEGRATTEKHYAFFRQVLQYSREREGRLAMSNETDNKLDPLMKEMGRLEEKDWEEFFSLWKDFPMIKFPPVTKSFYFGSPTSDHVPTLFS